MPLALMPTLGGQLLHWLGITVLMRATLTAP
jgi:hypothetical protein